jgi:predicted GNAT family acetyltransferase
MEKKVIHEEENERFVIYKDGKEAYVEYTPSEGEFDLYHTHTDPELRGQGLAAQVVRAALEYIKENNMKVVPTCSYVQSFLEKNEEYKELVAE